MAIFNDSGRPEINNVTPYAAIPGGEFQIRGRNFAGGDRPRVLFGEVNAPIVIGSNGLVIARVPDGASGSKLILESGSQSTSAWSCGIGVQIADSLHPVASPAVDLSLIHI